MTNSQSITSQAAVGHDRLSNDISLFDRRKRPLDIVMYGLIYLSAALAVLILLGILVYVLVQGLPSISWEFLSTVPSFLNNTFGALGNIVNTLYIIIITLLISTPLGIGAAIYLNEYAKPGKIVKLIEFTTETLSGIPSIIYGLFGMVFFGSTMHLDYSILCGSLTLTIMILPIITRTTQEALKTVPESYRQGALGIGATKWYMIRTIILPSALPGVITAVILSIGRIVGESAALIFTAGNGTSLPNGSLAGVVEHTTNAGGTLAVQLYLEMSNAAFDNAFGLALVLVVVVLIINLLTKVLSTRFNINKEHDANS